MKTAKINPLENSNCVVHLMLLTIDHPCMSLYFRKGHLEVVTYLITQAGVDVTATDSDGRMALHWACS